MGRKKDPSDTGVRVEENNVKALQRKMPLARYRRSHQAFAVTGRVCLQLHPVRFSGVDNPSLNKDSSNVHGAHCSGALAVHLSRRL